MTDVLGLSLLALLVGTAVVTAALRDRLAVVVVFAAYSLVMAILWVSLRAPDVALTEAAVGAGVTTSLFLVTVVRTARRGRSADTDRTAVDRTDAGSAARRRRLGAGVAVGALVLALGATLSALPAVGDPTAPGFGPVAEFYLTDAPELGVPNVVTAILVAYRGFDTFGEVVVVFAAGLSVLVVAGREVLG